MIRSLCRPWELCLMTSKPTSQWLDLWHAEGAMGIIVAKLTLLESSRLSLKKNKHHLWLAHRTCGKNLHLQKHHATHVFEAASRRSSKSWSVAAVLQDLSNNTFLVQWLEHDPITFGDLMGVSKNRDTPKWMVYEGNPIKMDDLGIPLFLEASLSLNDKKKKHNDTIHFSTHFWRLCGSEQLLVP